MPLSVFTDARWDDLLAPAFHSLNALHSACHHSSPDVPAILADPSIQAVALSTPIELDLHLARRVLLSGKDLFLDNPLSLQPAGAAELLALALAHQRIFMVGQPLWFHPAVRRLRRLIDTHALGRIQYLYATCFDNALSDASDDTGLILSLLDEAPLSVTCEGTGAPGDHSADVTLTQFAFPSGIRAHVFSSRLHASPERRLVVVGSDRMAVFDHAAPHQLHLYPHRSDIAAPATPDTEPLESADPLTAQCAHFLHCIATRQTPETGGPEALRLLQTLDARREALQTRRPRFVRSPESGGIVLVVGGAGYIGALLVERLLSKGHRVRVLDSLLYGDHALLPVRYHPGFELIIGDCRNIRDVARAVRGVESVIHLAAIVGDPACNQDQESALQTNYAATRMLAEIAAGHGVTRMLFASSCSVYGAADVEMDEGAPVLPVSLYGLTKVHAERALLDARSPGFHPTILRYATAFGLGHRPRFDLAVNVLTAKALTEGQITIYNGHQWRPFIHVRDIVEATLLILQSPLHRVSGEVFNVGDSSLNLTIGDVAAIIGSAFPRLHIEHVENADRRNYRVDFSKLHRLTGFRARYGIRDGIDELRQAFEDKIITDYTDLRYHNQRYLEATGSPAQKEEADAFIMAAFSSPHTRSAPLPVAAQLEFPSL